MGTKYDETVVERLCIGGSILNCRLAIETFVDMSERGKTRLILSGYLVDGCWKQSNLRRPESRENVEGRR